MEAKDGNKMNSSAPNYYKRPMYLKDFVMIDGITRSGKFMLAHILASFERVEFFQYQYIVENLLFMLKLGKIDEETFKILSQTDLDYATYNLMIGRGLNTRLSDSSCIYKSTEAKRYIERSETQSEDVLIEKFVKENRMPCFIMHEALSHIQPLLTAFPNVKIVHLLRHPVSLVNSWFGRGWGKRWGADPKSFPIAFQTESGPVPWFALNWTPEYYSMPELDRVVKAVTFLYENQKIGFEKLSSEMQSRIQFVSFEMLTASPEKTLKNLEIFLNTKTMSTINTVLLNERIPRSIKNEDLNQQLQKQLLQTSPELHSGFKQVINEYTEYWQKKCL